MAAQRGEDVAACGSDVSSLAGDLDPGDEDPNLAAYLDEDDDRPAAECEESEEE